MKRLIVPMLDGKLIADVSTDPDYPGIDVEFVSNKDNGTELSRPRVLVEEASEGGSIRALIWNNPKSEDFELEYMLDTTTKRKDIGVREYDNNLVVSTKSAVLEAYSKDTGIMIKVVQGSQTDSKVFIHPKNNKLQVTIWYAVDSFSYTPETIELYTCKEQQSGMRIRTLIQELQEIEKRHPDAVVKMHHPEGDGIMFAVAGKNGNVWLEGREDMDVIEELRSQYEIAAETQRDELDFFTEMVDRGFTLTDFCFALPNDQYLYAKNFMEEHGLI